MLDKEKVMIHLCINTDSMTTPNRNYRMESFKELVEKGDFDAKPVTCRWNKEYIHHNSTVPYQLVTWHSDCGLVETLKNFYKFCPSCGKPIEEVQDER